MDRIRRHVAQGIVAAAVPSVVPTAFAQSGGKRLTLAHNLTPTSPKGIGADAFAQALGKHSKGRLSVHVAHSEQLGPENTNMSALRTGCSGTSGLLSRARRRSSSAPGIGLDEKSVYPTRLFLQLALQ